ncbi:hypothetical protein [Nitrosomonas sp. ANs5]|uniref:hypothetical protein n=1 Tax=Nitrosomonas sp. ANs5 TaxID=3423941 RepID=UPI003D3304AB
MTEGCEVICCINLAPPRSDGFLCQLLKNRLFNIQTISTTWQDLPGQAPIPSPHDDRFHTTTP